MKKRREEEKVKVVVVVSRWSETRGGRRVEEREGSDG